MIEQNLYRFVFTNENGIIANVIVCSNKGLTESQTLKLVSKEVTSNYCEDNHCPYSEAFVAEFMDATSVQKLGTFRPSIEDYCNDDFTIIALNKTSLWRK